MSPISIPASYILILHIFHNDKKLALLLLLLLLRFFVLYRTTSTLCGMIQLLYVHALLYRLDFLFLFLFLLLVASC